MHTRDEPPAAVVRCRDRPDQPSPPAVRLRAYPPGDGDGSVRLAHPVDLRRTVFPLVRGSGDPTTRVNRATVWRAGSDDRWPGHDPCDPARHSFRDRGRGVGTGGRPGTRRCAGPRRRARPPVGVPRGGARGRDRSMARPPRRAPHCGTDPFPVLVAAVLEQKVTGIEARRAWRTIVRRTAEPAPGVFKR